MQRQKSSLQQEINALNATGPEDPVDAQKQRHRQGEVRQ